MKASPTGATAWTSSKPPLLRFLNACHADFAAETGGAVADYIPELGKADPAHFGISLATLDGHVYEVRSPLSGPGKRLTTSWLGKPRIESVSGIPTYGSGLSLM